LKQKRISAALMSLVMALSLVGASGCSGTTSSSSPQLTSEPASSVSTPIVSSAPKESSNAKKSDAATVSNEPAISDSAPAPSSGALLKVNYLDVGQGDSEFIELPNGQTMLIDAGNPENGSGIVSYITSRGHNKIDYLIATHPHADHIGGMATVVDSLDIGTIYMPRTSDGDTPTTSVYKKLLTSIQSKGLKINTAKAGVSIVNTGSLSATMIAPNSTGYGDLNQYSAVIMLTYGKNKFLFMGDAGNTSESEIAADVSADVLKVGHHGSKTATSQKFLNKVHPKQAVIEVGSGNKYGHPTQQALNRLKSIGATVYRTDLCSTIVFTSDSNTITVNKSASSVKEQAPPSSKASTGKATLKSNATITPKSTAPAANNAQGITVYITNTGKKYHSAGCRYLSKSCIPISLSEAKAEGYTPCSRCNPPE